MRSAPLTAAIGCLLIAGCSTSPGVIHGRTVILHAEASGAAESMDQFVSRIAPRALAASKAARAAVCGEVVGTGDEFSVRFKTDGYADECTLPGSGRTYILVNGTASDAREDHFSQINWQRPGYLITPWSVKYQDGVAKRPRTIR